MPLPPEFIFNQSNLQDYADCQRRFELRYLDRLAWPALESEPVMEQERRMDLGRRFHRLVQQSVLGLPLGALASQINDPDLRLWWDNFLQTDPMRDLPTPRLPEYTLTAAFFGYRLLAKFDLLAITPGESAIILDWKTSLRRTPAPLLKSRLQTRLYPFLLVLAGAQLNGGQPLRPEQVEIVYWFAEFSHEPERIHYSEKQYQADKQDLARMIAEIRDRVPGTFSLTPREERCRYCSYRSLCNRGVQAGDWRAMEDQPDSGYPETIQIDFDQIGEISF